MEDREAIEIIEDASYEIESLRRQVQDLSAKAHAYETITRILDLKPKPSQGSGTDIMWKLNKKLAELRANPAPKGTVAPPPEPEMPKANDILEEYYQRKNADAEAAESQLKVDE